MRKVAISLVSLSLTLFVGSLATGHTAIAWGWNGYGQCTVSVAEDLVSISAGHYFNLALKADGSIVAWGNNDFGQCNVPPGKDFVAIAARNLHR